MLISDSKRQLHCGRESMLAEAAMMHARSTLQTALRLKLNNLVTAGLQDNTT